MWCWRKRLSISWQEHRKKWFNINRIGPGKRVNWKSGKAETTIFWPHYSRKCRTVGTYSPRRNHGRVTASKQTEKTVDTRHWRVDWLRIHSAKGDVTRSSTMEKKDIGVVASAVANPHRGRSTSEWVSYRPDLFVLSDNFSSCHTCLWCPKASFLSLCFSSDILFLLIVQFHYWLKHHVYANDTLRRLFFYFNHQILILASLAYRTLYSTSLSRLQIV